MPNDHDTQLCQPGTPVETCAPCGLHQPVRNAYYDGRMIYARDMTAEQTYHNGLRHLGHQLLHGSGTVCGLKVLAHPQEGCRSTHVVLTRGMALDCCGQEVIVPQDVTIPVLRLLRENTALHGQLDGTNRLVLSLCRMDSAAETGAVLLSECCAGLDGQLPSRIAEGYGFALSIAAPGSVAQERAVREPDLDWTGSLNTLDEVPSAVAVDHEEGLIWVASALAGQARIRAYDDGTHALTMTLTGWERVDDIAAPRAGKWLFVAGRIGPRGAQAAREVVALYPRRPGNGDAPAKLLGVSEPSQIAVSPITGALFALSCSNAGAVTLRGWTADRLDSANPQVSVNRTTTGIAPGPLRAGVRVMEVAPDGRTLALLLPGAATSALHLANVSELLGGTIPTIAAMARPVVNETGTDVTARYAAAATLRFSADSGLLHIVGRRGAAPDAGFYARVFLNETGPVQTGQGLALTLSDDALTWPALYVAPDERWIYISTASQRGGAGEGNGLLAVYGVKEAKGVGATPVAAEPIIQIPLAAQLSGGAIDLRGQLAYLPGFERLDATEGGALRGRVMVVEISETDIKAIFEAAIEGCTRCEGACSCVPLAHLTGYVWNEAAPPRMMDMGEGAAGDAEIDNLSWRRLVPSNVTLMEAILEIAARGVESGPPGPRGEDGLRGADGAAGAPGATGAGITEVRQDANIAVPALEPIAGGAPDQRLVLPVPAPGAPGARGASIAAVAFGNGVTPRLDPLPAPSPDLRLVLPFPQAAPPPQVDPDRFQFVTDRSWAHGDVFLLDDLTGGALDEMRFALHLDVPDPAPLFTQVDKPVRHFHFSGALEIRVHWHRHDVKQGEGFSWLLNLGESRSVQYVPRFIDPTNVFSGQVFRLPMADLWQALAQLDSISHARVDVLLHGAFLSNAEKLPFDGRPEPNVTPEFAGVTGGTWRSWIEVQTDRLGG